MKLKLLFLFTFFSALSSFSFVYAEEAQPFIKSDEFKIYGRNEIYIYEPCNSDSSDDSDPDDPFSPKELSVGGSSLEEKFYSAARVFGEDAVAVGISRAIASLGRSSFPYFLDPSKHTEILEKALSSENFSDYTERLNSSDVDALIAAEFFYFYSSNSTNFISALSDDVGTSDQANATLVGKNFLETLGLSSSSFTVSAEEYTRIDGYSPSPTVTINLSSSSSSADYTSSTLIIGDSLTHRSEADTCDNTETFCNKISSGTGVSHDRIDAVDGRSFEQGIDALFSKSTSGIKYILIELGNNNCSYSGCTAPDFSYDSLKEKIGEINLKFSDETDGSPMILLVLGYRSYDGGSTFNEPEPSYNKLYRQLVADSEFNTDGKIMLVDGWLNAVKSDSSLIQNIGHPTEKGAEKLAEVYRSALLMAQTKLLNLRDTRPCDRASLSRRQEREIESEVEDFCFSNPDDPECLDGGGGDSGDDPGGGGGGGGSTDPIPEDLTEWFRAVKSRTLRFYMRQCAYKHVSFSRNNICTDGCSVTAFSMVISIFYNKTITPETTVNWTGRYRTNPKTDQGVISTMANNASSAGYNLKTQDVSGSSLTISKLDELLKQKKMFIISCEGNLPCGTSSHYTGGHFFAVVGIDPDNSNNYIVANPGWQDPYKSRQSYSKTSTIQVINKHHRTGKAVWRAS